MRADAECPLRDILSDRTRPDHTANILEHTRDALREEYDAHYQAEQVELERLRRRRDDLRVRVNAMRAERTGRELFGTVGTAGTVVDWRSSVAMDRTNAIESRRRHLLDQASCQLYIFTLLLMSALGDLEHAAGAAESPDPRLNAQYQSAFAVVEQLRACQDEVRRRIGILMSGTQADDTEGLGISDVEVASTPDDSEDSDEGGSSEIVRVQRVVINEEGFETMDMDGEVPSDRDGTLRAFIPGEEADGSHDQVLSTPSPPLFVSDNANEASRTRPDYATQLRRELDAHLERTERPPVVERPQAPAADAERSTDLTSKTTRLAHVLNPTELPSRATRIARPLNSRDLSSRTMRTAHILNSIPSMTGQWIAECDTEQRPMSSSSQRYLSTSLLSRVHRAHEAASLAARRALIAPLPNPRSLISVSSQLHELQRRIYRVARTPSDIRMGRQRLTHTAAVRHTHAPTPSVHSSLQAEASTGSTGQDGHATAGCAGGLRGLANITQEVRLSGPDELRCHQLCRVHSEYMEMAESIMSRLRNSWSFFDANRLLSLTNEINWLMQSFAILIFPHRQSSPEAHQRFTELWRHLFRFRQLFVRYCQRRSAPQSGISRATGSSQQTAAFAGYDTSALHDRPSRAAAPPPQTPPRGVGYRVTYSPAVLCRIGGHASSSPVTPLRPTTEPLSTTRGSTVTLVAGSESTPTHQDPLTPASLATFSREERELEILRRTESLERLLDDDSDDSLDLDSHAGFDATPGRTVQLRRASPCPEWVTYYVDVCPTHGEAVMATFSWNHFHRDSAVTTQSRSSSNPDTHHAVEVSVERFLALGIEMGTVDRLIAFELEQAVENYCLSDDVADELWDSWRARPQERAAFGVDGDLDEPAAWV